MILLLLFSIKGKQNTHMSTPSFTAKQNQELAELLLRQQNEMQALLTKSSMGCVPVTGDNVMLEIDGQLRRGTVGEGGPHFDGSIDILTEEGERHVYCQLDRVQLLRRGRCDSISSEGMTLSRRTSGSSFFSSRRGSDIAAGLSRRSSETVSSRRSSKTGHPVAARPPLPTRKPNAPLAEDLINRLNSFSLSTNNTADDDDDNDGDDDE